MKKRVVFSVTNDLNYDQRMIRICGCLSESNYQVTLVGVKRSWSKPLNHQSFKQKRFSMLFKAGKLFFLEYNLRLFIYLLFRRFNIYSAVDLDSAIPQRMVSWLKRKPFVFDAHELYTELPEVLGRGYVGPFWNRVEKNIIPKAKLRITVTEGIAKYYEKKYKTDFLVVRNVPVSIPTTERKSAVTELLVWKGYSRLLLYQGWLNKGRGLESLIGAIADSDYKLIIAGKGDLEEELKKQCADLGLRSQVKFLGFVEPATLKQITEIADVGFNLLENLGKSYFYSLANKFFDYVHADLPQIGMNFPEYRVLNQEYQVSILLDELNSKPLRKEIDRMFNEQGLHRKLVNNCALAKQTWNWESEKGKMVAAYDRL